MTPVVELFLANLSAEARAAADTAVIASELPEFIAKAEQAWPDLELDHDTFVTYVAERFAPDQTPATSHAEGLFLACACAQGDNRAVSAFRDHYGHVMDSVFRRLGFQRLSEEVTQRVLRAIFVHDGKSGPAILSFTGRGSLASWVRVLTVRESYRATRHERRKAEREVGGVEERIMDRAVSDEANPELLHLKRDYRAKFKMAFQSAFGRLSNRERNILRYQYLDGLNIDQIGAIYAVSRATVARWRARARAQLLSETRKIMRDEYRVPLDEFDNAMKLIESAMDVSLSRLLTQVADEAGREPEPDEG